MTTKFKIWGLEVEELFDGDFLIWRTEIRNPFREGNGWRIGLNEKFFREAWRAGVNKILLIIGQREKMMEIPTAKQLKKKVKRGEYEDRPSLFQGKPPIRIYHFKIL